MAQASTFVRWAILSIVIVIPIVLAAFSPLLAWRDPVYILAGFAGIFALALLLVQPLLAGGYLTKQNMVRARDVHRITGGVLVVAVVLHVGGLWVTSPPDVIDALLLRSPTLFSVWGVLAMWAVFAAAALAFFRKKLRLRPRTWRSVHTVLVSIVVLGTIAHAMLIEGTMETMSKAALCLLIFVVTSKAVFDLKVWAVRRLQVGEKISR